MERGEVPARIVLVVSNQPGAPGLDKARDLGLPAALVPHRGLSRRRHEERVLAQLTGAGAEWVCLAGYMRLLSPYLVAAFRERILNVHPSLLPAFPGLDAQAQAWRHGVRVAGCTVHLVDEALDEGPIVVQRAVEVAGEDTAASLAERILRQEHLAYPEALRRLLTEPWRVEGRRLCFGAAS
jgi:phosphoribosylglycinamide formyltransferase-1